MNHHGRANAAATLTVGTNMFKLTIKTATADPNDPLCAAEIAWCLRQVVRLLEDHGVTTGTIDDENGNKVGEFSTD